MTVGWARRSDGTWTECGFAASPQRLSILLWDSAGGGAQHIDLRRVVALDAFAEPVDGLLEIELRLETGETLSAWWPTAFVDEVLGHLVTLFPPPPIDGAGLCQTADRDRSVAVADGRPVASAAPRFRRWVAIASAATLAVAGLNTGVLWHRVDREPMVTALASDSADTWLFIGSDDRGAVPVGANVAAFGDSNAVPGRRADALIVVQKRRDRASALVVSIPRDLVVFRAGVGADRLALTLLDGPASTLNSLCRTLGIEIDHAAVVDFAGVADIVDGLGGVEVSAEHPSRDRATGLSLEEGTTLLDGIEAVAWARSRHMEHLVDGRWVSVEGSDDNRQENQRVLLESVVARLRSRWWNLLQLERVAWSGSQAVTLSASTELIDVARLGASLGSGYDTIELHHSLDDGDIPVARLQGDANAVLNELNAGSTSCPVPDFVQ